MKKSLVVYLVMVLFFGLSVVATASAENANSGQNLFFGLEFGLELERTENKGVSYVGQDSKEYKRYFSQRMALIYSSQLKEKCAEKAGQFIFIPIINTKEMRHGIAVKQISLSTPPKPGDILYFDDIGQVFVENVGLYADNEMTRVFIKTSSVEFKDDESILGKMLERNGWVSTVYNPLSSCSWSIEYQYQAR